MLKIPRFLLLAIVALPTYSYAVTPHIVIDEVRISGANANDEFIRLRNTEGISADLTGFKITEKTFSASKNTCSESVFVTDSRLEGKMIPENGAFLITHPDYTGTETADIFYPKSNTLTTSTMAVLLYAPKGALLDEKKLGIACDAGASDPPAPLPLPPTVSTVRINELFPNPKEKGEANEWIELYNFGSSEVDLGAGWKLRDKTTVYDLSKEPDPVMLPGAYLLIGRSASKIALNNSNEVVSITDSDGNIVDSVAYGATKEGASYGYASSGKFRWSTTPTPGAGNLFGEEPETEKTGIPKKAYKNVPAAFSARGNKKDMKYVWNFGDGRKSYKSKTTHTYEKTGQYEGTLTISDGTEETITPFSINVGNYPDRNIRITALSPNPEGNDSENEWIRIENREKKKSVNLNGWSIATGSKKKSVANHPVREDFILAPGEARVMTRGSALFTLPNERGIVELRRPDKKTVQTVKYRRDDGIDEGEIYQKEKKGAPWEWIRNSQKKAADDRQEPDTGRQESEADNETPQPANETEATGMTEEAIGGMSAVESLRKERYLAEILKKESGIDTPIGILSTPPRVLGATIEYQNRNGAVSRSLSPEKIFLLLNEWLSETMR